MHTRVCLLAMLKDMRHSYQQPAYQLDLVQQHQLCELNYVRLLRLFPEMFEQDHYQLLVDYGTHQQNHEVLVSLDVQQRSRYTTLVYISFESQWGDWLDLPGFEVRLYHDVNMAEVVFSKHSQRLQPRYQYPNPKMHQPDEKLQWNLFLAECLDYCFRGGMVPDPVSLERKE